MGKHRGDGAHSSEFTGRKENVRARRCALAPGNARPGVGTARGAQSRAARRGHPETDGRGGGRRGRLAGSGGPQRRRWRRGEEEEGARGQGAGGTQ